MNQKTSTAKQRRHTDAHEQQAQKAQAAPRAGTMRTHKHNGTHEKAQKPGASARKLTAGTHASAARTRGWLAA
jgi:hypothetical protein